MADRPVGKEKKVSGKGKGVKRRGEGLGTGPVGSGDGEQFLNPDEAAGKKEGSGKLEGSEDVTPGEGDDRDLGDVIQGLNTLQQLTGGGHSNQGSSGLGGLGQLLGGSGGQSSNQGTSGLGGLGQLLGGSGGQSSGSSNSGGSSSGSSGLGALGQLLGQGSAGGNNGGGNSGGSNGLLGGSGGGNNGGSNGLLGGSGSSGGGGKSKLMMILIVAAILFFVFGGGKHFLGNLFGGGSGGSSSGSGGLLGGGSGSQTSSSSQSGIDLIQSLLGGGSGTAGGSGSYGGWLDGKSNVGTLDSSVDSAAKKKRTVIKGDGTDKVTIMVYMCGTDLESRTAMATSDLNEMLQAKTGKNVNIVALTGGCRQWRNNVISSKVNQIYKLQDGSMKLLESNVGNSSMTNPELLAGFIQYCAKNFPANRNELIFWDHGGGSMSGYGYDEKYPRTGSMTLAGINSALKKGGVKFDFIGFDACLMATFETGLMLSDYADYMIASEESEPGIGWYYTRWLTNLEADPSMPTLSLGKQIADDFVTACGKSCPGQGTTLSLVDLAELTATAPDAFSTFATDTSKMITSTKKDDETANYSKVAEARTKSREFARGQGIDQVDLVHMAKNLDTKASKALANKLLGAIKYNNTSANMTNSYGLSIYFPYRSARAVDAMAKMYDEIGISSDYSKCIKQFAKVETGGQVAGGGSSGGSPFGSLFDILGSGGGSSGGSSAGTVDPAQLNQLIGQLIGGRGNIEGLNQDNVDFMNAEGFDDEELTKWLADNQFDDTKLVWEKLEDGSLKMHLEEEQWDLITDLQFAMFVDDGEGYVDLGRSNDFSFDKKGNLVVTKPNAWIAVDGQEVAYYYDGTVSDGKTYSVTGHIPVKLNDQRANLLVEFTDKEPDGKIVGAQYVYDTKVTETVAKNLVKLKDGDRIDFLADYYSYKGKYEDSYMIGDQLVVKGEPEISYVELANDFYGMYRFTDIYNQYHFSQAIID